MKASHYDDIDRYSSHHRSSHYLLKLLITSFYSSASSSDEMESWHSNTVCHSQCRAGDLSRGRLALALSIGKLTDLKVPDSWYFCLTQNTSHHNYVSRNVCDIIPHVLSIDDYLQPIISFHNTFSGNTKSESKKTCESCQDCWWKRGRIWWWWRCKCGLFETNHVSLLEYRLI